MRAHSHAHTHTQKYHHPDIKEFNEKKKKREGKKFVAIIIKKNDS